ncbi:MAG: hypothetical protein ABSH06_17665 [Thermodesulfobacteriota bacterium]|jgi:hypothetical protein
MPKANLSELAKNWPSPFVARTEISKFTGGMISPGYLSNLDSQGAGPERIKVGGKVVYPVHSLIHWLEQRSTTE